MLQLKVQPIDSAGLEHASTHLFMIHPAPQVSSVFDLDQVRDRIAQARRSHFPAELACYKSLYSFFAAPAVMQSCPSGHEVHWEFLSLGNPSSHQGLSPCKNMASE